MRRWIAGTAMVVSPAVVVSALVMAPSVRAPSPESADKKLDAALSMVHVGRDERTLVFDSTYGGCTGPAHVDSVEETRTSVRVSAHQTEDDPRPEPDGTPVGCSLVQYRRRHRVRLHAPVRGRRIFGDHDVGSEQYGGTPATRREDIKQVLPRVVGLAPPDALRLLRKQRYRTRIEYLPRDRALPRVVRQRPAPGGYQRFPGPRVTLFVRR